MNNNFNTCDCAEQEVCSCPEPIVCIRNLTFAYENEPVLQDINLCVTKGISLGIVGPNGGGKSTLLKLIVGILPLQTGQIEIFGIPIQKLGERRRLIGYVPQKFQLEQTFPATVLEVVLMGAAAKAGLLHRLDKQTRQRAMELLRQANMAEYAHYQFAKLSGGQQQRVLIVRALITEPQLLILDEPMSAIDVQGQTDFFEFLRQLKEQHKLTLIMVSHDVSHLLHFADQIACLCKLIHWHNRTELITEKVLEQVYACELNSYLAVHRRHIQEFHS